MKCPKCGYNSFEILDSCKKCSSDLSSFKQSFGIRPIVVPVAFGATERGFGNEPANILDDAAFAGQYAQPPAAQPFADDDAFEFDMPGSAAVQDSGKDIFPDIDLDFPASSAVAAGEEAFSFDQDPFADMEDTSRTEIDAPEFGAVQPEQPSFDEDVSFAGILEDEADDPFKDILDSPSAPSEVSPSVMAPDNAPAAGMDAPWDETEEAVLEIEDEPATAELLTEEIPDDAGFELENFAWEETGTEQPPAAKKLVAEPEGFSQEDLEALFGEAELFEENESVKH